MHVYKPVVRHGKGNFELLKKNVKIYVHVSIISSTMEKIMSNSASSTNSKKQITNGLNLHLLFPTPMRIAKTLSRNLDSNI